MIIAPPNSMPLAESLGRRAINPQQLESKGAPDPTHCTSLQRRAKDSYENNLQLVTLLSLGIAASQAWLNLTAANFNHWAKI
jgi:hypothetical protein